MKGLLKAVALSAAVTVTWSPLAPIAMAAQSEGSTKHPSSRYCVVHAVAAGAQTRESANRPACFGSFADAISFATDRTVRLPSGASDLTQADLDAGRAVSNTASTVIGIEYENTNFGGTQWIIAQASGCNDGGAEVWLRSDLTGTAMNNEVSSARTYAGCKSRHFDLPNFGGSSYLCGCSQMSSMNDRTTSIRWSATGL